MIGAPYLDLRQTHGRLILQTVATHVKQTVAIESRIENHIHHLIPQIQVDPGHFVKANALKDVGKTGPLKDFGKTPWAVFHKELPNFIHNREESHDILEQYHLG